MQATYEITSLVLVRLFLIQLLNLTPFEMRVVIDALAVGVPFPAILRLLVLDRADPIGG